MRLRRPSPAMLVALLALFVALGGSSYAAFKLPKNSVGPSQLRTNAVTSSKVKAGSLLASDLKTSQRSVFRGPQGPQGDTGPAGVPGAPGAPGAPATKFFALVKGTTTGLTVYRSSGVASAVRDTVGEYHITFNQSLDGCVAVAGQGTEGGFYDAVTYIPEANISADDVLLTVHNTAGNIVDGEVGLAVFC